MSRKSAIGLALSLLALPLSALGAVASMSFSASEEGPNGKALRIAQAVGGHRITVKLAALGKGAKVHRARLRARRGEIQNPQDLLTAVEIYPGRRAAGKPLALAGPDDNAFDVTDAVRKSLSAGGELELFVKSFPAWLPAATRLEVIYDGAPPAMPPPVKGLKAFHRAGQTFLWWNEVDPPIKADKATWGQFKKALAGAKEPCTYRVYAHGKPIDAGNILEAELLGEVEPLSCWNVHGRNMEYLIGQAMQTSDEMGELARNTGGYMYTWGPNHARMDRYPLDRLVVDAKAGPLPPGSGLYVAHPAKAGKRCYAVVSCKGGVENLRDFSAGNSLAKPVAETVGLGEPVHQGPGLWGPFFDYPGRRQVYVQWAGPPLSPRRNMYFNWSVLVPPGLKAAQKAPGELYFHGGNFSYAKPRKKFILQSIQIAPHDWPFSGWYGFNEAYGTLRSYKSAAVSNHTQRRIIAFLDWAKRTLPLDADRIMLPGGDGAVMLALAYPEVFSYVLVIRFNEFAIRKGRQGDLPLTWGPKSPDVKDGQGRSEWGWAMLDKLVLARRGRDLPLIFCRGYSWAPFVRGFARGLGRFYEAMGKANQPLLADWTWASGYLVKPDRYSGLWRGMDMTRTTPVPAFTNCSTDKNSEGDGQVSLPMVWEPIQETAESVQVVVRNTRRPATVDVALRRLQKFKVKPGEKLTWKGIGKVVRRRPREPLGPQRGTVVVDDDGVFVIKGLKVSSDIAVTVTVSRGK